MSGAGVARRARPIDCHDLRVAVVAARWHEQVMDGLLAGAQRALADSRSRRRASCGCPARSSCRSSPGRWPSGATTRSSRSAWSSGAARRTSSTSARRPPTG